MFEAQLLHWIFVGGMLLSPLPSLICYLWMGLAAWKETLLSLSGYYIEIFLYCLGLLSYMLSVYVLVQQIDPFRYTNTLIVVGHVCLSLLFYYRYSQSNLPPYVSRYQTLAPRIRVTQADFFVYGIGPMIPVGLMYIKPLFYSPDIDQRSVSLVVFTLIVLGSQGVWWYIGLLLASLYNRRS